MPVSTPVSLLGRLRTADFNAPDWTEFVQIYTPILLRWARSLGMQTHDAADLVQDLLLKLRVKLRDFVRDENRGRFRDWLRTVAVRLLWERERKRKLLTVDLSVADELDSRVADPGRVFEEREFQLHITREMLRVVQTRRVSDRAWQSFYQTVALGRKAAEVGRKLNMSEAAVQMAKGRVLRLLREELEGMFD